MKDVVIDVEDDIVSIKPTMFCVGNCNQLFWQKKKVESGISDTGFKHITDNVIVYVAT